MPRSYDMATCLTGAHFVTKLSLKDPLWANSIFRVAREGFRFPRAIAWTPNLFARELPRQLALTPALLFWNRKGLCRLRGGLQDPCVRPGIGYGRKHPNSDIKASCASSHFFVIQHVVQPSLLFFRSHDCGTLPERCPRVRTVHSGRPGDSWVEREVRDGVWQGGHAAVRKVAAVKGETSFLCMMSIYCSGKI